MQRNSTAPSSRAGRVAFSYSYVPLALLEHHNPPILSHTQSGLVSAVMSTFLVTSCQSLQPDPSTATASLAQQFEPTSPTRLLQLLPALPEWIYCLPHHQLPLVSKPRFSWSFNQTRAPHLPALAVMSRNPSFLATTCSRCTSCGYCIPPPTKLGHLRLTASLNSIIRS